MRPILSDRCFKCHGPDPGSRQAGLRLDSSSGALGDGEQGPAIVPGMPDESPLYRRITSHNADEVMPPPSSAKKPISAAEQDIIRRWIEAGAEYEPHWAFVLPKRPQPPVVKNAGWPRGEIDRFILAAQEAKGLSPSPEADRATLLRRVFLDLTGLPPTPEELDAFEKDERSDAYERCVDKLLTEEPYRTRYAERMAVPWLDAARYADTSGIHTDAGRQMWAWRDWVLNAYRDNMPFDRFVTEQLAGDLLPDATDEQKIASGFNRNHVTTDEGGAIAEEYLVEYAVERTATFGSVFLGLTMGCARCHEHKFDPISHDEFYGVYAFFNSIDEPGLYSQLPDSNRAFEPFMEVPSDEQKTRKAALEADIRSMREKLDQFTPEEQKQRQEFLEQAASRYGVAWEAASVESARSEQGATLAIQPDGSVLAGDANPDKDDYVISLRTQARNLRLISLEALTDPSLADGRVGRAPNGNAVLTGVSIEAVSLADPNQKRDVRLVWAWADHEQANGDFRVVNVLDRDPKRGWALNGHNLKESRTALFLADEPFGFEGGTEIHVQLEHRSIYAQHTLGRVRIGVGSIASAGLENLPAAVSGWYLTGPFPVDDPAKAYEAAFGPEKEATLDRARNFGFGNQAWRFDENLLDGRPNPLAAGTNILFVGREIFSPTSRKVDVSLGSDDGFALFLNGREIAAKKIERGVLPDQDRATVDLPAGRSFLMMKIVNTGGQSGFYYDAAPREGELSGALVAAILPAALRGDAQSKRLDQDWKLRFSTGFRERRDALARLDRDLAALQAAIPRTMVMRELPTPRETFVLKRGQYDKPDKSRPVTRGVPAALGKLPDGAPQNRLGLVEWLTGADNPLFARVTVNRFWEMLFGAGIVRSSEDFGLQGEWPSHPELLDWLAVDFREGGWDVRRMLRQIVTSATYRQSSRVRPESAEADPDNRLLSRFPRRRLPAEQIRDQALYTAGLLVEKLGGPSVKPYQPDGLWQEVAMPASNTRIFQRGEGEALWRRSLYTYWKRACPPPSLLTLDAPVRESCIVRRMTTNTPHQALVMWNDEQFVEAARALAARTLSEPGTVRERLSRMVRRVTGMPPTDANLDALERSLNGFLARYKDSKDDANALLKIGESPAGRDRDPAEMAAWTMIANAVINLAAGVTQG
ncbi:MAG: PSD1 domain-containing protein [Planctomycetes bacterium]|nr:PSD1 domain-containing protein [Planctomycetota bacterium]